jgi:MFS transporter, DHA1 family, multidrug resistance protein
VKPLSIVIYCGVLMSISAFAVDILLPGMPAMVSGLQAPYAAVQWTVTAFVFSAGLAQLVWGPASDRFGRRPVMAVGLCVFLFGCLMAAFAPSVEWLLGARVVQGIGAAAAIVLGRAIMRDLFSGEAMARNLALAMTIFAVGPVLAPLLGAAVLVPFGWRSIFVVLALLGVVLLVPLVWMRETLAVPSREATRPAVMGAGLVRLFTQRQSRYFLLLSMLIMSIMVFNLASLPRVYDVSFGVTGLVFALFFAVHGTGIIIGQAVNRRIIPLLGTVRAMLIANAVLIVSAGMMLGLTLAGLINVYVMSALLVLFATGYLVILSNAIALVLDPHGEIAGFAASVFGVTSQIGAAAIVSVLVIPVGGSVLGYSVTLLSICLATFALIARWHLVHGDGRVSRPI